MDFLFCDCLRMMVSTSSQISSPSLSSTHAAYGGNAIDQLTVIARIVDILIAVRQREQLYNQNVLSAISRIDGAQVCEAAQKQSGGHQHDDR